MKKVIALTSGGIDSPELLYILAKRHPELAFLPLYYRSKNSGAYWIREEGSNRKIWELFREKYPNVLEPTFYGGPEIKISRGRTAYRNQIFTDATVRLYGDDPDVVGMCLGICPGQEEGSWVHGWTLDREDHSPKVLEEYLKKKKPEWTMWSFGSFLDELPEIGKKSVRVQWGVEELGEEWLWLTTSCQLWFTGEKRDSYLGEGIKARGGCGKCHSCIARYVAIHTALGEDKTPYRLDPIRSRWLLQYAVEYRNHELFRRGLPFTKDRKLFRKELRAWLERQLNGS